MLTLIIVLWLVVSFPLAVLIGRTIKRVNELEDLCGRLDDDLTVVEEQVKSVTTPPVTRMFRAVPTPRATGRHARTD